jgi:chaperone BCS1
MLPIYIITLATPQMNDGTLVTLMGCVPTRSIVLLEDVDTTFMWSVTQNEANTGIPTVVKTAEEAREAKAINMAGLGQVNTITLSGILNALDGVSAAEG